MGGTRVYHRPRRERLQHQGTERNAAPNLRILGEQGGWPLALPACGPGRQSAFRQHAGANCLSRSKIGEAMNTQTATTTSTTITTTALVPPAAGERNRGTVLCLIVHDELELRLRLAGLVRRAMPKIDADTVTRAGFDAISIERLRAYVAVMFIVEFSPPDAATASLASLKRLHEQAPNLPIFVFARGGNERSAARAMKLGASDYWPIHSVIVGELCSALQPLIEPPAAAAANTAADRWRQPEVAGYTMMKKIAQSSIASVYLARNDEFPQPVALKIEAITGT